MKHLIPVMPFLIMLTGCSFATKGSIIPTYQSPKTVLLVLDMQEDFLGENAKMPIDKEQIPVITAVANSLIDEFERDGKLIIYVKSEFPTKLGLAAAPSFQKKNPMHLVIKNLSNI
jgi:nicotinamidase-related amidase